MGAAIDSRTDVFAFGTIMFEGLCGYRAYDAPNFNALIVMIATTQPKKIDDGAPKLPEALRAVVRECMMTDKAKRMLGFEATTSLETMLDEVIPWITQAVENGTL